jgi:hypothetical protein
MLKANQKDLEQYKKMLLLGPKAMRKVIAKTINSQASSMKFQHMPKVLNDNLEIRDVKFMNRQLWVNKAKLTMDPSKNFSEAGSLEIKGGGNKGAFTGWSEFQEGKQAELNRTATTAARTGGSFKRKMARKSRMRNTGQFRRLNQYQQNGRSKAQAMFLMLRETREQKLNFIVTNQDQNLEREKAYAFTSI